MKNETQIRAIVEEAAKILKDYPHLKYYQAIIKAKEVLKDGNFRKTGKSNNTRRCHEII